MKRCWAAPLLGLLVVAGPQARPQEGGDIRVRVVKYPGLADVVRQHRGKVVVVDFWFTT